MAGSYYKSKKNVNQMRSVMTNMMAGLNEFEKSDMIGDNNFSDVWDVSVDDNSKGLSMYSVQGNMYNMSNSHGNGAVVNAIAAKTSAGVERVILITHDDATADDIYFDDLISFNPSTNVDMVTVDISSHSLTGIYTSMCTFNTEANRYVCFVASGTKKLLYYNFTTVGTVTLPFYPKKMVSHYNRLFILDTGNKLWWCRAGDFYTWYGLEEDVDRLVTTTAMLDSTAYTLIAQPDVPRPLSFTITTVVTADTLGTLTVVGVNALGVVDTKIYTPIVGKYITPDSWTSVTSITATSHVASGTADTISIGIAPVSGYVQEDQGYWTIEEESQLVDLTTLGSNLYIWSPTNIYVFQGYSPDTFSLTRVISDLGCYAGTNISACGNIAYFWGTYGDLYEYDGNSFPQIINHPVYVNGSVANGIYGGMPYSAAPDWKITTISSKVFLYWTPSSGGDYITVDNVDIYYHQMYIYEFDTKSRSWWKRAGFSGEYTNDEALREMHVLYIPDFTRSDTYNIMHMNNALLISTWGIYDYMGSTYNGSPFVVTKAFNDGLTNDMSLTNIILYLRYNKGGEPE